MPQLFLSPSTQEYNIYYDGNGNEEYYMNLIADAMEPYLVASGITFTRNDPDGTVGASVRQSNAGDYRQMLFFARSLLSQALQARYGSTLSQYPISRALV